MYATPNAMVPLPFLMLLLPTPLTMPPFVLTSCSWGLIVLVTFRKSDGDLPRGWKRHQSEYPGIDKTEIEAGKHNVMFGYVQSVPPQNCWPRSSAVWRPVFDCSTGINDEIQTAGLCEKRFYYPLVDSDFSRYYGTGG